MPLYIMLVYFVRDLWVVLNHIMRFVSMLCFCVVDIVCLFQSLLYIMYSHHVIYVVFLHEGAFAS